MTSLTAPVNIPTDSAYASSYPKVNYRGSTRFDLHSNWRNRVTLTLLQMSRLNIAGSVLDPPFLKTTIAVLRLIFDDSLVF